RRGGRPVGTHRDGHGARPRGGGQHMAPGAPPAGPRAPRDSPGPGAVRAPRGGRAARPGRGGVGPAPSRGAPGRAGPGPFRAALVLSGHDDRGRAGGRVEAAEAQPPGRGDAGAARGRAAGRRRRGGRRPSPARRAGWVARRAPGLTVRAGLSPARVDEALRRLEDAGAIRAGDRWFAAEIRARATEALTDTLAAEHERDPLRAVVPRAALRASLPDW